MVQPPRFASVEDLDGEHPLLTLDEFADHAARLAELKSVRDRDLPRLLRDARGFVGSDAAEEIVQIREDQTVVDARISHLEAILRDARVLDDTRWDPHRVIPGRVVTVRYGSTGREVALTIASSASHGARPVSARSPVGRALLGRAAGEAVSVVLPNGRTEELTILSVEPGTRARFNRPSGPDGGRSARPER